MKNRTRRRWPWPTCGPITTSLGILSATGWTLLSVTGANNRWRSDFWAMALTGLAVGCTRFAVQNHLRTSVRFSEQTAEAVQQVRDAVEDSLLDGELVDRVAAAALRRVTAAPPPGPDPPPGARTAPLHDDNMPTFDPLADTLSSIGVRLPRTA
jgi:hypothetical protein